MTSITDELRQEAERAGEIVSFPEQNFQNLEHLEHLEHQHESKLEVGGLKFEQHVTIVERVITQAKENPELYSGLYASAEFIGALKSIRSGSDDDEAYAMAWASLRVKIKKHKPNGITLEAIDDATKPDSEGSGDGNTASALIRLVTDHCELFFESTHDAFVTITGENITLKVGSSGFAEWVSYKYYMDSVKKSASEAAIKQATWTIKGICQHEGKKERVFMRVAKHDETGAYYLFMGDDKNSAIEITATGWRVVDQYPVKFWKPALSAAFPEPVTGGDINKLWDSCNIPEEYRLLILAWILDCWRIDTPYPVLGICGVQGSAKSSAQKNLVMVADPSTAPLRKAPKNDEDIIVAANNGHVVSFENMSYLSPKTQDTLCTMSTGGSFAKRALYTDNEESVTEIKSPCIINGIVSVITAQDLTERSIHVELPRIEQYRSEGELQKAFDSALPEIFGGLLELFVKTLAKLPHVEIVRPPRMVDFCLLGEAMAQSMEHDAGVFTELYNDNRKDSVLRSIESSPIASVVLEWAESFNDGTTLHNGTNQELFDKLVVYRHDKEGWPQGGTGLAKILKRNIPALQDVGIIVVPETGKKQRNTGRKVTITKRAQGAQGAQGLRDFTQEAGKVVEPVSNKGAYVMDSVKDKEPF